MYSAFAYDAVLLLANVLQNFNIAGFDPLDGDELVYALNHFSGETEPPAVSGPISFAQQAPWGRTGMVLLGGGGSSDML